MPGNFAEYAKKHGVFALIAGFGEIVPDKYFGQLSFQDAVDLYSFSPPESPLRPNLLARISLAKLDNKFHTVFRNLKHLGHHRDHGPYMYSMRTGEPCLWMWGDIYSAEWADEELKKLALERMEVWDEADFHDWQMFVTCYSYNQDTPLRALAYRKRANLAERLPEHIEVFKETADKEEQKKRLAIIVGLAKTFEDWHIICDRVPKTCALWQQSLDKLYNLAKTAGDWAEIQGLPIGRKAQIEAFRKRVKLMSNNRSYINWAMVYQGAVGLKLADIQGLALGKIKTHTKALANWGWLYHYGDDEKLRQMAMEHIRAAKGSFRDWEKLAGDLSRDDELGKLAYERMRKMAKTFTELSSVAHHFYYDKTHEMVSQRLFTDQECDEVLAELVPKLAAKAKTFEDWSRVGAYAPEGSEIRLKAMAELRRLGGN